VWYPVPGRPGQKKKGEENFGETSQMYNKKGGGYEFNRNLFGCDRLFGY
jgi:hypothetical protein